MVDIKAVIRHLANGTLGESLCLICLSPLEANCENIFTKICKENDEFCVADALEICQMEISEDDNYNVCLECFVNASSALRFFFQVKRTKELLQFYTEELFSSTENINVPLESNKSICITLPVLELPHFEFSLEGIGNKNNVISENLKNTYDVNSVKTLEEDDKILMVIKDGVAMYFKLGKNSDGELVQISEEEKDNCNKMLKLSAGLPFEKQRRKRSPMNYKNCTHCPVKYRFLTKLKHHMKNDHNIDLYICKICKAMTEDKQEYHDHMRTHTNIHQCAVCNMVFKRRSTIISHLQQHEKMKNCLNNEQIEGAHICELCGMILEGEDELLEHKESRHEKKHTCYYCGKMYKSEQGLDAHIRKHEAYMLKNNEEVANPVVKPTYPTRDPNRRPRKVCATCGKDFVDQRALLWHQRLHTNERPYTCNICGRGFVSLNRRNQHMVCAHSAPTKGCPLCPALFHLRSMVNTHIKKVHLQAHKRRNKTTKHRNVFWRTEAVPIQELSVSIQNEILQMQAQKKSNNSGQLSPAKLR
ncbi:hypothetical protein K1T71_013837 [Dendrolimus kikuchii]|uniref:Uncharacterized protein n=1 Tax=Dendrolimus kikuchii TaxID=765133 RepID=A0ACC1CG56_9NEOP|nr:hypothetical protein K1T71_013837 [Dendrolimus kikuchii]